MEYMKIDEKYFESTVKLMCECAKECNSHGLMINTDKNHELYHTMMGLQKAINVFGKKVAINSLKDTNGMYFVDSISMNGELWFESEKPILCFINGRYSSEKFISKLKLSPSEKLKQLFLDKSILTK